MMRVFVVIAIFFWSLFILSTCMEARADEPCLTLAQARKQWPKAHLYWHTRAKCWDNVRGGNKKYASREKPAPIIPVPVERNVFDDPKAWKNYSLAIYFPKENIVLTEPPPVFIDPIHITATPPDQEPNVVFKFNIVERHPDEQIELLTAIDWLGYTLLRRENCLWWKEYVVRTAGRYCERGLFLQEDDG